MLDLPDVPVVSSMPVARLGVAGVAPQTTILTCLDVQGHGGVLGVGCSVNGHRRSNEGNNAG